MPKNTITDKFLAVVFALVIMLDFIGVYYIANNMNSEDESILWVSGADTEFPTYAYSGLPPLYDTNFTYGTNTKVLVSGNNNAQVNYTPAYLGNNSWGVSIGTELSSVAYRYFTSVMDVPNLQNWIITRVKMNVSLNPANTDCKVVLNAGHHNLLVKWADATQGTVLIRDASAGGHSYINYDEEIALEDALRVYDFAQSTDYQDIYLYISDEDGDGWEGWACKWSIEIYGQTIEQYDIQTYIMWYMGAMVVIKVLTFIFMLDDIDIGGKTKDIYKAVKPRTYKKKKSKRRR